jgi:hypothetical protein
MRDISDTDLIKFTNEIDNMLVDSCIKYDLDYSTITACILARIVAISRQVHTESEVGRLLSLAQSSIMESPVSTIQ